MSKIIKKEVELAGRTLSLEVGRLAQQANGSVLARYGETAVLATATEDELREGIDYFPLRVDFIERLYAGGVIKGSRFVKREGRPSDEAILAGRVIDRSIRPIFPDGYKKDVQVIITALSVDEENDAELLAAVASSAALAVSDIPWDGPIGTVRVGYDSEEDDFILNPPLNTLVENDLNLIVSGTEEKVIMIDASGNEVDDDAVVEAISFGQEGLQQIIDLITDLQSTAGKRKHEIELPEPIPVEDDVADYVRENFVPDILEEGKVDFAAQDDRKEILYEKFEGELKKSEMDTIFENTVKKEVRKYILENDTRIDGREPDEVRPVSVEVGMLPRAHGSGLFNRGDTQVLTAATLGSLSLEQMLESMTGESTKRYMHHYYFPPFSTGETAPLRGPGRREIGHGALAEKALRPVLPSEDEFPYAIRLVSEVLSSAGSTSMASTCGSTLALMDAGVPISSPVAGIAMGMIPGKNGEYKLLTDIAALEDFYGGMDFKVTGTREGITAIQLDVKIDGLTPEIIKETIRGAREARLQILDIMEETIEAPRDHLSMHAPRVETIHISPEKIGKVIGPGGKMIRSITEETGAEIDIEEDGTVSVTGTEPAGVKKALETIQGLTAEPEVGKVYEGRVTKIMDFGAFVEILPGQEGLVHVSEMTDGYVEDPHDVVSEGDEIKVKLVEVDEEERLNLSIKALSDGQDDQESQSHYQKAN
ncbi:MAG: polyribonucleotide nucleotidyltransferase [Patescibacteria group bacterium]